LLNGGFIEQNISGTNSGTLYNISYSYLAADQSGTALMGGTALTGGTVTTSSSNTNYDTITFYRVSATSTNFLLALQNTAGSGTVSFIDDVTVAIATPEIDANKCSAPLALLLGGLLILADRRKRFA